MVADLVSGWYWFQDKVVEVWDRIYDVFLTLGIGVYGPWMQATLIPLLLALFYSIQRLKTRGDQWMEKEGHSEWLIVSITYWIYRFTVAVFRPYLQPQMPEDSAGGSASGGSSGSSATSTIEQAPVLIWSLVVFVLIIAASILPVVKEQGGAVAIVGKIILILIAFAVDVFVFDWPLAIDTVYLAYFMIPWGIWGLTLILDLVVGLPGVREPKGR